MLQLKSIVIFWPVLRHVSEEALAMGQYVLGIIAVIVFLVVFIVGFDVRCRQHRGYIFLSPFSRDMRLYDILTRY